VQHRAVLGRVDVLAGEHRLARASTPGRLGEFGQQRIVSSSTAHFDQSSKRSSRSARRRRTGRGSAAKACAHVERRAGGGGGFSASTWRAKSLVCSR
jgi:hypothetical protein